MANGSQLSASQKTYRSNSPYTVVGGEAAASEFSAPTGLFRRVADGVQRRAEYLRRRRKDPPRHLAAERALDWLVRQTTGGYLTGHSRSSDPSLGVTAAALETLADFGEPEVALRCAKWLVGHQHADGSFPEDRLQGVSLFNTSQAARGLSALAVDWPELESSARHACGYLADIIDDTGQVRRPSSRPAGAFEHWAPEPFQLSYVWPLVPAARQWKQPEWEASARRVGRALHRRMDLTRWQGPSHLFAYSARALLKLGYRATAMEALRLPAARLRSTGAVPVGPNDGWVSSAGLAHLATLWYELGERSLGDRALAAVAAKQTPTGGFPGSWGRGAAYFPHGELAPTALHFLEAARLQVHSAFDAGFHDSADTIDPDDGRAVAVSDWLAGCDPRSHVADVGCGTGRYLKLIEQWLPKARLVGIDPSSTLLSALPDSIQRRDGGLLRLPAQDGEFDAVLAVESFEHALAGRRAVDELCRIVRPGGRVLLIDKDIRRQPLSHHESWERWFAPDEVRSWLAAHCDDVTVEPIAHGDPRRSTGLYLCWTARRRKAAARQAA